MDFKIGNMKISLGTPTLGDPKPGEKIIKMYWVFQHGKQVTQYPLTEKQKDDLFKRLPNRTGMSFMPVKVPESKFKEWQQQQLNTAIQKMYPTGVPHNIEIMQENPAKGVEELKKYTETLKREHEGTSTKEDIDYYKKIAQKYGVPVRFNTHKYTDKEIESKLTEREFRTLAMFELDKLRGIKIGSVINPQSKETLDMMDNLEDYGLIKRFWYDIAVARPENRKMIPWTGEDNRERDLNHSQACIKIH